MRFYFNGSGLSFFSFSFLVCNGLGNGPKHTPTPKKKKTTFEIYFLLISYNIDF